MRKITFLIFMALLLAACVRPAPTPEPAAFATDTQTIYEYAPTAAIVVPEDTPEQAEVAPTEEEPTPFIITPTEENPVTPTSEFTETPSITDTPAPTSTPTEPPTPDAPGFDPVMRWNSPRLIDEFDNDDNWVSNSGNLPDTGNIKLEIADNTMYVTGKNPDFDTWWLSSPTYGDMYLEMTVNTGDCVGSDAYGVILRAGTDEGSFGAYIAGFTCKGEFFVRRVDSSDPYVVDVIYAVTRDDDVRIGADKTSVLGFLADGNQFTVFSNGYELGTFYDDNYELGRYGVFVKAGDDGPYTYQVEQIRMWDLRFK